MTPARVAPPVRRNTALLAGLAALAAVQFVVLPLWLLPRSPWWGLVLAAAAAATFAHWALIHEAVHGLLLGSRRANDAAGRALAVLWGAPLRALRIGHLLHHRHSRLRRERAEVYDPAVTPPAAAAAAHYARLAGGVYAMELATLLVLAVPRSAIVRLGRRLDSPDGLGGTVIGALARPDALRETRLDAALIVLLYAGATLLYGTHAWMLAGAIALRAVLASLTDNAFHYGTRLDRPREALDGTLPAWASACWLHFNLHGTHHRHPHLPWHALPDAARGSGAPRLGAVRCLARQLRGPIPVTRLASG